MEILQAFYDSEINFEISAFWDGGFTWKLGDSMNGFDAQGNARTIQQAVPELSAAALKHYPDSAFANRNLSSKSTSG
jgi:hypothetical protein